MIQFKNDHCCVFESALFKTTSTVIWTGDLVLVVDPNWLPSEITEIRQFVDSIKGDKPVFLLFTHSDYDHIIGYGAFPEARVIASVAFAKNQNKDEVLEQIDQFDQEYYIDRLYPIVYPQVDEAIKRTGQTLTIGRTNLVFYLAPGHNPDGLFTIVEPLDIWITGDYLSNVEFPYIYHSFQAYVHTLDRARGILDQHQPALLVPGHGRVTGSRAEMEKRLAESRLYLTALKKSVLEDQEFPEETLWQRYNYPKGMSAFHEKNLALARKELIA